MFANIYIEIEQMLMKEMSEISTLEEGWFSLHSMDIDLISKEVELSGYDKLKGEEFTLFYNYSFKSGKIQYNNGLIERFSG